MEPIEIKLSVPVLSFGKTIDSITLRPPNGGDMRVCGSPTMSKPEEDGSQIVSPNYAALAKYIARLGGVGPNAVDALDSGDATALYAGIIDFFSQAALERMLKLTPPKVSEVDKASDPARG